MDNTDMQWHLVEPDFDEGHWTTKDGKRIKIKLMESSHIENCIKMLKKNKEDFYNEYIEYKIQEFEEELKYRKVLFKEFGGFDDKYV